MKVSIITCTFNCFKTIEDCIESVLGQTYEDIEYIVIDGGSIDGTKELIQEKYADQLAYFVSEPDKGIYDALNKGIQRATGEIIAIMHADDVYTGDKVISRIVSKFQNEKFKIDGVYGDLNYTSKENTSKIIRNWQSGSYDISRLKKGWMPPHPTLVLKKSCYDQFGYFDTSLRIAADYDLMMRFLKKHEIKISYETMLMVNMRVGGKSNKSFSNIVLKMQEDYKVIRRYHIGSFITLIRKNTSKLSQFF